MKYIAIAAIIAATLTLSNCNIQFQDTDRTKIMWDTYCSDTSLEWKPVEYDDYMQATYTTEKVLSDKDIEYGSPMYNRVINRVSCAIYPTTIFGWTPKTVFVTTNKQYGKNITSNDIFINKKGYVTYTDAYSKVSTNESDNYSEKHTMFETTETPLGKKKWVRESVTDKNGKETITETNTDEQGTKTVKNLQ